MEGGNEGLCLLCCTDWSLGLDSNDWGIRCGCFCGSCSSVWTISSNVSLLIALEAKSTLDPLSFFFVRKRCASSGAPYVHSDWVAVGECVPPLWFCCSSSSFSSLDFLF